MVGDEGGDVGKRVRETLIQLETEMGIWKEGVKPLGRSKWPTVPSGRSRQVLSTTPVFSYTHLRFGTGNHFFDYARRDPTYVDPDILFAVLEWTTINAKKKK